MCTVHFLVGVSGMFLNSLVPSSQLLGVHPNQLAEKCCINHIAKSVVHGCWVISSLHVTQWYNPQGQVHSWDIGDKSLGLHPNSLRDLLSNTISLQLPKIH